jgi:hypothetical protein
MRDAGKARRPFAPRDILMDGFFSSPLLQSVGVRVSVVQIQILRPAQLHSGGLQPLLEGGEEICVAVHVPSDSRLRETW